MNVFKVVKASFAFGECSKGCGGDPWKSLFLPKADLCECVQDWKGKPCVWYWYMPERMWWWSLKIILFTKECSLWMCSRLGRRVLHTVHVRKDAAIILQNNSFYQSCSLWMCSTLWSSIFPSLEFSWCSSASAVVILFFPFKFFYTSSKTAESLEKRCQVWLLWIHKSVVKEAKNVHFLNENVFGGYPRRRDMGLPSKV